MMGFAHQRIKFHRTRGVSIGRWPFSIPMTLGQDQGRRFLSWRSRERKRSLCSTGYKPRNRSDVRKEKQIAATRGVAKKLERVLEFFFGCWHRNRSRPFTLSGWTYVVCLNCGKQFGYIGADFGSDGVTKHKAEESDPMVMPAPR
jgi:hypothetical protein